jgi:hypothetical protein
MPNPEWQKRRGALNHDWLKGRFSRDLSKWLNVLDGLVEDVAFEQEFLISIIPQWELYGRSAVTLAREFEEQMSPQRLLEQVPFSQCSRRPPQWLGVLVHDLWLSRYPVREWISAVTVAASTAEETYLQLQECRSKLDRPPGTEAMRPLRHLFSEFRRNCNALAEAIERFPSEVRAA